jgi:hypothetical protein
VENTLSTSTIVHFVLVAVCKCPRPSVTVTKSCTITPLTRWLYPLRTVESPEAPGNPLASRIRVGVSNLSSIPHRIPLESYLMPESLG